MESAAYDTGSANRYRLLVIGTMAWLLTGCQAMSGFIPLALQPVAPSTAFKVLTDKTLHSQR